MKVLLLDDHTVVRAGLRLLVASMPEVESIVEAGTLAEALAGTVDPDVIVADLILPDGAGADIARQLGERYPSAETLALTMIDAPATVEAVLAAGARGYLLKDAAADELVNAIRAVAEGRDYVQPSLGAVLARRTAGNDPTRLTDREREVLRLVVLGHTNAEIGSLLHLSQRTVETHRSAMAGKLGTTTRAELVRAAIDRGLVDLL